MNPKMIKELEQAVAGAYQNITGLIVQKDGIIIYEKYFGGFAAEDAVHVFSVTKSIVSALIGIAIDKGHILSDRQAVLNYFPGYTPRPDEENVQQIEIRHLLSMTAPYKYEVEPFEAFFTSDDWIRFALDLLDGKKLWVNLPIPPLWAHISCPVFL